MHPRFGYTIVYVPDVAAALHFYEEAFGLKRKFLHESGTYGELDTGHTALAFVSLAHGQTNFATPIRANDPHAPPAGIELAIVVKDVEAAWQRALKAGATALAPPVHKPWGQTVAFVRDLNGVIVELCTAM